MNNANAQPTPPAQQPPAQQPFTQYSSGQTGTQQYTPNQGSEFKVISPPPTPFPF
jgi:hypothetical protein